MFLIATTPPPKKSIMISRKRLMASCVGAIALLSFPSAVEAVHRGPPPVAPDADWPTRHMAEEHHIGNFDPGAFFSLHDFDDNGRWDEVEIQTTYGLYDKSNKDTPQEMRDAVVHKCMELIDKDGDGSITRDEWMKFIEGGGTLPDFGVGPGHHGDDEYEYEIHHWELYHDENTKEEDLIHAEDIEHFKHHDDEEDEQERIAALDKLAIVEQNIPQMFRRH